MKKIFSFMLEHLHYFYFSLGHNVWLKYFQVSQTFIPVGYCLMTNAYFQLWYQWIIHFIIQYNKGSCFEHITTSVNIYLYESVSLLALECVVCLYLCAIAPIIKSTSPLPFLASSPFLIKNFHPPITAIFEKSHPPPLFIKWCEGVQTM